MRDGKGGVKSGHVFVCFLSLPDSDDGHVAIDFELRFNVVVRLTQCIIAIIINKPWQSISYQKCFISFLFFLLLLG